MKMNQLTRRCIISIPCQILSKLPSKLPNQGNGKGREHNLCGGNNKSLQSIGWESCKEEPFRRTSHGSYSNRQEVQVAGCFGLYSEKICSVKFGKILGYLKIYSFHKKDSSLQLISYN
jgi:hypothetical protein